MANRRRLADDQPQLLAGWRPAQVRAYRWPALFNFVGTEDSPGRLVRRRFRKAQAYLVEGGRCSTVGRRGGFPGFDGGGAVRPAKLNAVPLPSGPVPQHTSVVPWPPLPRAQRKSHVPLSPHVIQRLTPADSSRPSIFTLLSFSAYSDCASRTLGSLRVWQSPTA